MKIKDKEVGFVLDFGTIKTLKKELGVDYFGNAAKKWQAMIEAQKEAEKKGEEYQHIEELDLDELTAMMIACSMRAAALGKKSDVLTVEDVDSLSMPQLLAVKVEIEMLMNDFEPEPDPEAKPVKNSKRRNSN